MKWLALLALFAQNPYEIPFRHVVIDANVPDGAGDCKGVGDIDGDGYPDIVFAGAELAWYRYPDWKKTVIAKAEQEFSTDMQVADMDGDGDLDIVVPDGKQGKIWFFENRGREGWKPHLIGMQGSFAHDVEVGDFNGDGKLDVLTRKKETLIWLQHGPDSWERVVVPNTLISGEGTALADINGDGRLDIVQGGYWLEAPNWVRHEIAAGWPRQIAVTAADLNGDGRPDVIIGPAESAGKLVWYENPTWTEHLISDDVSHLHTFKVADINNDGRLEIVAAEMQQSKQKRVLVFFPQKGKWKQQVVATTGSHNLRLADIGRDGDIDIIGANWGGQYHPLEMWENQIADDRAPREAGWSYTLVDGARAKWGDFAKPAWLKYLGLAFGDVTGDGRQDIVSGRYFYRNPGKAGAPWARVDLGRNVDAMLTLDADHDGRAEVIAEALPDVFWMRPRDRRGSAWEAVRIGTVPPTGHVNSQGAVVARIGKGRRPSVILTGGDGIYAFEVPAKPSAGEWPRTRLAADTSEEGIAAADFDGDGRLDIAASDKDGRQIFWLRNPGWERVPIGRTEHWADRVAAADLNGDGRPDVVVAEECAYAPASVYWFENPGKAGGEWKRHEVVTQYSTNSLGIWDMNHDGVPDIVTNEHRGARRLAWWENQDHGARWVEHLIDVGKEGHLGARLVDLDGKGTLGIAAICWDTYQNLHLWRRDAATH